MKTKILAAFLAGALALANAQDKSILETLVKKGTISEQEAAQIAKDRVVVTPSSPDAKVLTIGGGVDVWYSWGSQQVKSPSSGPRVNTNGFELRYVKVDFGAEIIGGWTARVVTDFGSEGQKRNYLDTVVISKKIAFDYLLGTLDVGMRKVNMGLEQGINDFDLLTIERSVATWFFTRPDIGDGLLGVSRAKNFGSRAIGAFWDGAVEQVDGLTYGAAVVGGNSYEGTSAKLANYDGNNNLSFYANVAYASEAQLKDETFTYKVGLNYGYANGAFVRGGNENYAVWGVNPYVSLNWRGATVMLEYFLQRVDNGNYSSGEDATPQGFNATIAYKFDIGDWGKLEPVFRASMIATDGMGFNPVTMGAFSTPGGVDNLYNRAQTYYIGANWYVIPSVKVGVGYEWGEYTDKVSAAQTDNRAISNTVRASLQVLF